MIITKLQGGLGNQLFQYAVGRHLALKNNAQLKFDLSFYGVPENASFRPFELGSFQLASTVTPKNNRWNYQLKRLAGKLGLIKLITERNTSYNQSVLAAKGNVYLEGYWQSERYFAAISDTIRHDLTFPEPVPEDRLEIIDQIKKNLSVAVHIRRGDYVKLSNYVDLGESDYYKKAVDLISSKLDNIVYFIFSDDIDWVKQNIHLQGNCVYVEKSENALVDLQLISLCQHQIIANSSFSWWGAWLNKNPTKTIIAPNRWFSDPQINTSDIIPSGWIKI
ncbi:alpha-1,2-fucosyltransferase [Mucilaginibacter conchicola]|uniref:Alpha-1,2-fucosyltransferase n=1 Tax=Mucilaginibacter conchicola TaxID=2303333 RepID=A0A372NZQ0_9SPHI|nr:alpha-1,2-fucosyltransferase [Mucilaginibacter conchicola]RFZ95596.1 alpha-1,2-fucosyltransferase [Mucilaginibacter conchicola]